jgi:SEC-C motif
MTVPSHFDISPYDPCPCGSGAKYKFCCAAKASPNRRGRFPVGTVALYDKVTTKIAASVVLREGEGPAHLERWVGTQVLGDPKVSEQIRRFFASHGVKSVVMTSGNIGCPHEEGPDFSKGSDCPFCPFWRGKQGSAARDNP